jgi:hypothetical protein
MIAHITQEDHGMWSLTMEEPDGRLWLHSHAGTRQDMLDEVEHADGVTGVVVEPEKRPYPKGGNVRGYRKPNPRRAVR